MKTPEELLGTYMKQINDVRVGYVLALDEDNDLVWAYKESFHFISDASRILEPTSSNNASFSIKEALDTFLEAYTDVSESFLNTYIRIKKRFIFSREVEKIMNPNKPIYHYDYPHICDCGEAAYRSMLFIKCTNPNCMFYEG